MSHVRGAVYYMYHVPHVIVTRAVSEKLVNPTQPYESPRDVTGGGVLFKDFFKGSLQVLSNGYVEKGQGCEAGLEKTRTNQVELSETREKVRAPFSPPTPD